MSVLLLKMCRLLPILIMGMQRAPDIWSGGLHPGMDSGEGDHFLDN